ncbi:hypothetical protein BVC80_7745g4 [Macleaya cordata]|uniref:Zinc finger protein n=1 Tax=Macleaya cordata TaxID=56857 RepID=A0A200QNH7_MACCD|nr:hypothetical protein BVC80_7745g4 [Macleaya cordata]
MMGISSFPKEIPSPSPPGCSRKQLAAVCQKCGVTGFAELLIYCNCCRVSAEHRYCLDKIPKTDEKEVIWSCEKCASAASCKSQQDYAAKSGVH